MKKKILHKPKHLFIKIFVLIFLSLAYFNSKSQTAYPCGGYKINKSELAKALQFEKNKSNVAKALSTHYLLRVYFHILKCNDGSHAGATEADLKTEFATLLSDYAPGNICFINTGFDYIYNSKLDTNFNIDTDPASQWDSYRVPNCINIFYPYEIKGTNSSCPNTCGIGGVTLSVPDTYCFIASGNIGAGHTISHEVGHCFGLIHTFDYGYGYEDIDGSNSATAGDLIQDTHADPYAFKEQPCFSVSGSVYNGSCTDPKGQSNYSPPYTNTMAYWWPYGYPNLAFTADQFTRIYSFLNSGTSGLEPCESADNITFGPNANYSSGYLMTSALNSFITTGSDNLNGTVIATLGGQTVDLKPGFDANAYSGAVISIEASNCSFTSKALNKNNLIADKNKSVNNSSAAYPNPTTGIIHLAFTTNKNESNVVVQAFNMEMQKVQEIKLGDLLKGNQNTTINLSKQASGLYYIIIQLQNQKLSFKVSVLK